MAWRTDNSGVYADVQFPLSSRHKHYYDLKPAPQNIITPDYQNYYTTTLATAYMAGSLRVYVNGIKISHLDTSPGAPADIQFPRIGVTTTWTSLNYSEDTASIVSGIVTSGKFALSAAITSSDRITIDFDFSLT